MCDWSWLGAAAGQSATTEGRSVKAHRGRTDGKHRDGGGGGEPVVVRSSCVSTRGERQRGKDQPAKSRRSLVNTLWLDLVHWLSNFR